VIAFTLLFNLFFIIFVLHFFPSLPSANARINLGEFVCRYPLQIGEECTCILLVVEPDYLPDLEVFYFQPCLYPMKYLHPRSMYTLPLGGVQRGGTPSAGSGGSIPLAGGKQGFGGEAPEGKIAL
jgi:hypothetical protein